VIQSSREWQHGKKSSQLYKIQEQEKEQSLTDLSKTACANFVHLNFCIQLMEAFILHFKG
jgi:hypothetical protein